MGDGPHTVVQVAGLETLSALSAFLLATGCFISAFVLAELDWRDGGDRVKPRRAAVCVGCVAVAAGAWALFS